MLPVPAGLVIVPLEGSGGCVLVLTEAEYLRAIRRGKYFQRREAEAKRAAREQRVREPRKQDPWT